MPVFLNIMIARVVAKIVLYIYRYENTSIYIFCLIQYTYICIYILSFEGTVKWTLAKINGICIFTYTLTYICVYIYSIYIYMSIFI